MKPRQQTVWDRWMRSLLLVRLGQELGSVSPLTKAIHDLIDALLSVAR